MVEIEIAHPEVTGVTESSVALAFDVISDGRPVDAEVEVTVGGEPRARSGGEPGTRLVRIEGLPPDAEIEVGFRAPGLRPVSPDRYFPERLRTLPSPEAAEVGRFATLNDIHIGEARMGGRLTEDFEYGEEAPGFPVVRAEDTPTPYWQFMLEDAIDEINALGVDALVIKGDIADRGRPEQFEEARRLFGRIRAPHHVVLGNHDHYAVLEGERVDGYALLGQPAAPRALDLAGFRLLLVETALPGEHHGVFPEERRRWLDSALSEAREAGLPTFVLMHHHPVPPEHAGSYPNSIGLDPEDSVALFELLGRHPQVRAVLVGHTHRNKVRRYPAAGSIPFVEVHNPKDYPGGYAVYRLFEDGSAIQEVRRTGSRRALVHAARCRELFRGFYRHFALGRLEDRSFFIPPQGSATGARG